MNVSTLYGDSLPTFFICTDDAAVDLIFNDASFSDPDAEVTIDWGNNNNGNGLVPGWSGVSQNYPVGFYTITYTLDNENGCPITSTFGVFVGPDENPQIGLSLPVLEDYYCLPSGGGNITLTFEVPPGVANNPDGTLYYLEVGAFGVVVFDTILFHPLGLTVEVPFTVSSCGFTSSNGYENAFDVSIRAENPCNASGTATVEPIRIAAGPVAAIDPGTDQLVCVDEVVEFDNASTGQAIDVGNGLSSDCVGPSQFFWTISPGTQPTDWELSAGSTGNDAGDFGNSDGWIPGTTGLDVQFHTPGAYEVFLAVANVCGVDTEVVELCVESPPEPDFSVVLDPADGCFPVDALVALAQANVEDCPEPLQFAWTISPFGTNPCQEPGTWTVGDPVGPDPGITFTGPGTYLIDLDLVDPGCPLVSDQQQVTVFGPPEVPTYTFDGTSLCEGDELNVVSSAVQNCDNGTVTVTWDIENSLQDGFIGADPSPITFTVAPSTNTIIITATNTCGFSEQTLDIDVSEAANPIDPQVDVLQICPGDPIEVTFTMSPGITYGWTLDGDPGGSDVENPFTITDTGDLTEGDHTVEITSSATGCGSGGASVIFQVQEAENVVITGPEAVCENGSIHLEVTGATNPLWSTGDLATSIDVVPSGPTTIYTVTSDGIPGLCPGSDEFTVTVIPLPEPGFTFVNQPCTDVDFLFTNTTPAGAFDWSWTTDPAASPATGTDQDFTTSFPDDVLFNVTLTAFTQTTPICSTSVTQTVDVVDGPTADITTLDQSVCADQWEVNLQADANGEDLVYAWEWVGGAPPESTLEDPGLTNFPMVGTLPTTYTVTFSANNPNDGCDAATDQITVTLSPLPVAAFVLDSLPCVGIDYFVDNVTAEPPGDHYEWYVDDVLVSTDDNLTYPFLGPVNVLELIAFTDASPPCQHSSEQVVNVGSPPTVDLGLADIEECGTELLEVFAPTTTGSDLTFAWTFSAGALPSSTTDPVINVVFPGNPSADAVYNVSVAVDNTEDVCPSATDDLTVTVLPFPVSVISADQNTYCEGDSVQLTNVGGGIADSFTWDFGDGSDPVTTTDVQVYHVFPQVEEVTEYVVSCTVTNPCGEATDTEIVTIVPSDITIAINTDPVSGCEPLTVHFQNNTASDSVAQWFFPDPFGMAITDDTTLTFEEPGVYEVIARSYGCGFDETTVTITVLDAPEPSFTTAPDGPCTNTPITFTSTAPGTTVVIWYFGDGGSSDLEQPTHLYEEPDTYQAQLVTGWSLNQCTGDTIIPVTVLQAPEGSFTIAPPVCAPGTICFDATTQSPDDVFDWAFPENIAISADEDPCVLYIEPGTFQATLVVSNADGCTLLLDTVVVIDTLPIAAFTGLVLDPCHLPAQAEFQNNSQFATGYQWSVDNDPFSTATNATLDLPASQDYTVSLTAFGTISGPECSATADTVITVFPPPLATGEVLTDPACSMQPVLFDAAGSVNGDPLWSLGDGTTSDQSQFTHVYALDSTYLVQLTIAGAGGCTDTLDVPIEVVVYPSPVAAFTWKADDQLSEIIHFRNASTGAVRWEWDFGDGSTSDEEHPDHRYNLRLDGCDWTTTLIAFSEEGCVDTTRQAVQAKVSVVYFMANAFTPNGQGPAKNERYAPDFVVPIDVVAQCEYHLTIFDRWGHPLFETTDPLTEWDGHFPDGNPVPQGPYTWAVHLLHPCIPVTFRDREGHVDVVR